MLAQHQATLRHPHRLRRHDLVRQGVREHPVLVNAGLMGKGVGPDNGLIRLDRNARDGGEQLRGLVDLLGVHPRLHIQEVAPGPDGHHDLFERGVSRSLPDAVDGALHLSHPLPNPLQGI